jgi:hypothetical protein
VFRELNAKALTILWVPTQRHIRVVASEIAQVHRKWGAIAPYMLAYYDSANGLSTVCHLVRVPRCRPFSSCRAARRPRQSSRYATHVRLQFVASRTLHWLPACYTISVVADSWSD